MGIKTVFGTFSGNKITEQETGNIIPCLTYQIVANAIENRLGFFNLEKEGNIWIVFQYALLD
jgi:hypothetical protein